MQKNLRNIRRKRLNKLLIFDLDGTLVDCKQLHRDAFMQAIGNQYYPEASVEGLPTTEKIRILNEMGMELDPESVAKTKQRLTFELFDAHIHYNSKLNKQLLELSLRYDIAICSNATRPFVEAVVDRLNIRLLLSAGVFTASEYRPKPNTDQWDNCILSWGGDRAGVTIFEDSPIGIMGARNTGCTVVEVVDASDLVSKLNEY